MSNNRLQRTALRAAAEPERYAALPIAVDDYVSIESSPGRLTLSDFALPHREGEGWYSFLAHLDHNGLSAEVRVHDHDVESLPRLFEEMAREYRGWKGEKKWFATEDQLSLTCTSDRTGHAFILITMRPDNYETWEVEAHLQLDAAQHEQIARHLRRLLNLRAA